MNASTGRKSGQPSVADARAAAQAAAKANRATLGDALAEHFAGAPRGTLLIRADIASTLVFTVLTVVAAAVNTKGLRHATAVVDLVVFVVGCVLFLVALFWGAQRSRDAEMTMAGWWMVSGSAPASVRAALLGCVGTQILVGIAGAALRPFTSLAFGVLVPTLGLALCGMWTAKHGFFPPRTDAR